MAPPLSSTSKNDGTDSKMSNLSIPGKARLTRELSMLSADPPPGIACYVVNESNMSILRAQITLRNNKSCYDGGIFMLSIQIPTRYPFDPPHVRFVTPLYHPNVDAAGRICLDTLKSPPAGSWSPAVSLPSLLLTLQTLLCEPNPDDALMADIADQYKRHYTDFFEEARKRTKSLATAESYTLLEQKLDGKQNTTIEEKKISDNSYLEHEAGSGRKRQVESEKNTVRKTSRVK